MGNMFNSRHAVFCCVDVLDGRRPVLAVVRDVEGEWQFRCDAPNNKGEGLLRLVAAGDLLERDPSLAVMINLRPGWIARRVSVVGDWVYSDL